MSIISEQVTSANDGYRWAGEPSRTFSYVDHGGPSGARAAALAYAQHVVAQREASAGRKLTNYEHLHGIDLKSRPDNRTVEQRLADDRWKVPSTTKRQDDKWERFIDPPVKDTINKPIGELVKMTVSQRLAYYAKERRKVDDEAREASEALDVAVNKRCDDANVMAMLDEIMDFNEAAKFDGKVTQGELVAMDKAWRTLSDVEGDVEAAKQYIAEAKATYRARIQSEYDAEAATFNDSQGKLAALRTQLAEAGE